MELLFRALVAMVVLAPIAFGAVQAWAWSLLALGSGILLAVWGALVAMGRARVVRMPRWLWYVLLPFVAAMGWAVFQTLSWSPAALHHPLWHTAVDALGLREPIGAISLDPAASREGIGRIATCAGVFWLALQLGRSADRAGAAILAIAVGATTYALYGLFIELSGENRILWIEKTAYRDVVTSTFVNRNSFATFAGLGLLCATASLVRRIRRVGGVDGRRERLRRLLAEHFASAAMLVACCFVLAVALLLSESRAGIAASMLGLLAFATVLVLRHPARVRSLAVLVLVFAVVGTGLFGLSGGGVEQRLVTSRSDWTGRAEIHAQTTEAIADAPLLGTGLGTFESVYRLYRTGRFTAAVNAAHNDYLELALELGIPAAASFVATLAGLGIGCGIGVFARRRHRTLAATGFAACVLVGTHAVADFSLQIPAIGATFALLLGVSVAQSWPHAPAPVGGTSAAAASDPADSL